MSHPRIEEVEDSDDAYSDPSEGDIDDFDESDILRARQPARPPAAASAASAATASASAAAAAAAAAPPRPALYSNQQGPPPGYNGFATLYPVYFDRDRSRAQGRRVSRRLAVDNPLARDIVSACAQLGLRTVFEPAKTHPKDWANPGRVKVNLSSSSPSSSSPIHGKHHLYILVARYLADHPTTENSLGLREPVQGAPEPPASGDPFPRPAIPRGWKMPALVPYLSPAMTGGGVSENFLQDVMKEMGGAGAGGAPGLPGNPADIQRAMQALGAGGGSASAAASGSDKKSRKTKGR